MSRPHLIGLTGSIGMGKSTAARMFRDAGIPVWDADAAVHELYKNGGAAVAPIRALRPEAVGPDGVDRQKLNAWIAENPDALALIEGVVHPMVAKNRQSFIDAAEADLVVLDIPLLFETGGEDRVDTVVVVSAPEEVQRARVLDRPGMTEARLDHILSKQLPDDEKRGRADVVVPTVTMDETRDHITALIERLRHA
ncbi:dephospho-CoA kinase [Palleronia abyssalis]|uniref:Dephospho-CoA kinase n=1 Tax=Palleronia abyssalis TaxID=1501240 RepID=A0A2R8BSS4_9RHOB|nr:dephospho-CoA kinase [Palleronia abyssalis]SPJ23180.1 Dephospho-CoA kinase [Palleronia abyssalis]